MRVSFCLFGGEGVNLRGEGFKTVYLSVGSCGRVVACGQLLGHKACAGRELSA